MFHAFGPQCCGNRPQILVVRAVPIKPQRQMRLLRRLLLVGDQIGHQRQQLVIQLRGRRRIQDHRHTGLPRPTGHRPIYLNGNLQLQKHQIIPGNGVLNPANLVHRQRPIGAGDHHNAILGSIFRDFQRHMAHAGVNPGVYRHMACIHAGGLKRLQKLLTKEIVAHSAHHGDIRTQPGALKPFPPGAIWKDFP